MNQIFLMLITCVAGAAGVLISQGRLLRACLCALVVNALAMTTVNSFNNHWDVEHNVMQITWVGILVTGFYFIALVALFMLMGKWFDTNKPANGYGVKFSGLKTFDRSRGAFTQQVDQWAKPRESQKAPTSAEARGYKRVN